MNKYLFLFTIGPVQSFISQARKSQDLFSGSRLLSDLITFTITLLPPDSELIFPRKDAKFKPNRFIAIINSENEDNIKELGVSLEKRLKLFYKEKSVNLLESYGIQEHSKFENQIDNHLQIYWVAIKHDEEHYKENYERLESSMGSIKNVRAFEQFEETGKKCSLCGERNALYNSKSIGQIQFKMNHDEGLCGVCVVKRLYNQSTFSVDGNINQEINLQSDSFPSTAEIALSETLEKIKLEKNGKELLKDFDKNIKDYQMFYEENLNDKYFENEGIEKTKLSEIKAKINNIKEVAKGGDNLKFSKYYSLIMFDGDNMGEWLSGNKLKETEKFKVFHKNLTSFLNDFAQKLYQVLKPPFGNIIYAGGEDFLGFININYIFKSIIQIRLLYDDIINKNLKEYKKYEDDNFTFSAGIIVSHYKNPFSEVLKEARLMERKAKEGSKNSFAIAVLKHSGETINTVYNWENDKELCENYKILQLLTDNLRLNNYSNTFINNLEREFIELMDKNGKISDKRIVESELKRLVNNSKLNKNIKDTSEFINNLNLLFNNSRNTQNFISALNIAEFISMHLNGGNNDNKN